MPRPLPLRLVPLLPAAPSIQSGWRWHGGTGRVAMRRAIQQLDASFPNPRKPSAYEPRPGEAAYEQRTAEVDEALSTRGRDAGFFLLISVAALVLAIAAPIVYWRKQKARQVLAG